MVDVLNETLYSRLKKAFGYVKISNRGQAMKAYESTSLFAEPGERDRPRLEIEQDGEYYLVSCPYCSDTRFRLYVNHMYGQRISSGRQLNFLAICYNEACMQDEDNYRDFQERLALFDSDLEEVVIKKGIEVDRRLLQVKLPGPCRLLSELPRDHHARKYVEERNFDPDRLASFYGVSYCLDSIHYLARRRLVIPIYWQGKLVGWQTRHIGELNWKGPRRDELPPKYWTMPNMPKGNMLMNFHNAKKFVTGVIVEGWFDVFGFGPMAMPVLGNSVSEMQKEIFVAEFGQPGRSGVLLLDPEEYDSVTTQRDIKKLKYKMSGQLAAVRLPTGMDPGSADRGFLRDYVYEHALEQGVEVSYERVQ